MTTKEFDAKGIVTQPRRQLVELCGHPIQGFDDALQTPTAVSFRPMQCMGFSAVGTQTRGVETSLR
jgi:hypothetical protein